MSKKIEVDRDENRDGRLMDGEYFAIFDGENAKCSCGRPLEKISDKVYRCSYGFPQYHLDDGDVVMDKFGNLYLKEKNHDPK